MRFLPSEQEASAIPIQIPLVLINKSATAYDRSANLRIEASIGETLSQIVV
jgi:hypothetical protein